MNEKLFGTETKEWGTANFALILNALYAPIVGAKAVLVYNLLNEWHRAHTKVRALDRMQLINDITGLNISELDNALKSLEAVGLIRRYERVDENAYIFQIIRPLTARQFQANSFLFRAASAKIGQLATERVLFMHQEPALDKTDYREVTTRFQDLFEVATPAKEAPITSTLEVPLNAYQSKVEAAKHLNAAQYLKFVTSKRATPSQIETLNRVQQLGFANASVNAMIDYVMIKNESFVAAHLETIAQDLARQGVHGSFDVSEELAKAVRQSQSLKVTLASAPQVASPARDLEDWEQIFNALGGEL